jgi:hypothetical protein
MWSAIWTWTFAGVRDAIEAAKARLHYLPPYSPDFNPIEMAFSKLKALLRKAAPRAITDLWETLGNLLDAFTPRVPSARRRGSRAPGYSQGVQWTAHFSPRPTWEV